MWSMSNLSICLVLALAGASLCVSHHHHLRHSFAHIAQVRI